MSNLTELEFVNIKGRRVDTSKRVKLERKANESEVFHKGYVVEGLPPGSLEVAMQEHARARAAEVSENSKRIRPEWNLETWLAKAKAKRVRSKPCELKQAALECKALAEKAGWLRVEIRAMSKGAAQ
jgi:hypothetical protein